MNFLKVYSQTREGEARIHLYKNDLCYLIDQEVYSEYQKAIRNNWRLGGLHDEWNSFLKYKGINIKAPRDHLKTFFFSEMYPLMRAKFDSGISIRIFSGTDALAIEILDHIKKKWAKVPYFKNLLAGADLDNKKQVRFSNGSEIYAQGFWGKIRGGHSDIIVLDDIIDSSVIYSEERNKKSKERLATEILPMAEPDTQIIIVGTLQKDDDIYSVNWEEEGEDERKWISKSYDAIIDEDKHITLYPEKWPWKALMAKKKQIISLAGLKWFQKEYRNMATNLIGEIIKPEWTENYYDKLPELERIVSGWDLSVGKDPDKGDYTANITFGIDKKENIYIIRAYKDRIEFPIRLRKVDEFGRFDKPARIKIEENIFQADTVQTLKNNTALPIEGVKTTVNKIKKFNEELAPLFENGKVFFKRGDKAQEEFRRELCSLPRGKYDDMADAFCIGLKGEFSNKLDAFFV